MTRDGNLQVFAKTAYYKVGSSFVRWFPATSVVMVTAERGDMSAVPGEHRSHQIHQQEARGAEQEGAV